MRRLSIAVALALAACSSGGSPVAESTSSAPASTTTTVAATTSTPPTTPSTAPPTTSTAPPLDLPDGPAYSLDFPDPFVLWGADKYHAISTSSGFVQVPHLASVDVVRWDGPGEVLDATPVWAQALSIWAPSMVRVGDTYVLWFTALVRGTDRHCISFAASDDPDGPFVDENDAPVLCPQELGGAIDPSPFVDDDGSVWLLWKNDGVTLRRDSSIWTQRVDRDGTTLLGDPIELIRTDQAWEYPHVEAPSMARVGDDYWLAYSGNWWNQAAYGVGLARCESPAGPCTKPFDRAVISSAPARFGPGGGEFFRDASGRLLIAYHAWLDEPGYPGHRALFVADVAGLLDAGQS